MLLYEYYKAQLRVCMLMQMDKIQRCEYLITPCMHGLIPAELIAQYIILNLKHIISISEPVYKILYQSAAIKPHKIASCSSVV